MLENPSPYLKTPSQKRSIQTTENILEAAKLLSDEGVIELLSARSLSEKSGYSIGTIYHYFEKIEYVLLELFLRKRKKGIAEVAKLIDTHDPQSDVSELMTRIVDMGIKEWRSKNPIILKLAIRQFFKNSKEPEKFNLLIDDLIPSLLAAQKRDLTNTFRLMSDNELRLQIRAIQMTVRNPFFEDDPFAGSPDHRRWTIEMAIRLFGKPSS
jgi:AcrR family transcriptional regulator